MHIHLAQKQWNFIVHLTTINWVKIQTKRNLFNSTTIFNIKCKNIFLSFHLFKYFVFIFLISYEWFSSLENYHVFFAKWRKKIIFMCILQCKRGNFPEIRLTFIEHHLETPAVHHKKNAHHYTIIAQCHYLCKCQLTIVSFNS